MPRRILRQVDTFAPVNSTPFRRAMPLGTTVVSYPMRLTGTYTNPAGGVVLLEDSPYGYIRGLDIMLNGSFPLRSALHGRSYFFFNRMQYATPPQFTAPATGASAVTSIVAELKADMGQPELLPPLDSSFWLDTRLLSRLELVFTFGADQDIATGAGATITAQSLTVYAEEVADAGGITSKMQEIRLRSTIGSTGLLDFPGGIPALGPAYRAFALHFVSGNADEIRATSDDTILTDASLVGDNVVRYWDAGQYRSIRQDNKISFAFEAMPAGWAVLDFARSKTLRDLLLTARTRSLNLRLNIGAAPANAIVEVYPFNALLVVRGRGVQALARRAA